MGRRVHPGGGNAPGKCRMSPRHPRRRGACTTALATIPWTPSVTSCAVPGHAVPLRPKVFHVLAYLLAQRDRVVSKDELMAQVWPGQSISEETLSSCITAARRAVADSGQAQQVHPDAARPWVPLCGRRRGVRPPPLAAAASVGSLAAPGQPAGRRLAVAPLPRRRAPTVPRQLGSLVPPRPACPGRRAQSGDGPGGDAGPAAPGTQRQEAEVLAPGAAGVVRPVSWKRSSAMAGPSRPCRTRDSWRCLGRRWRRRTMPGGRCGRRSACSSACGRGPERRRGRWGRAIACVWGCIRGRSCSAGWARRSA